MDQRRLLLFCVLSMGIMMIWAQLFAPPPKPPAQQAPDEVVIRQEGDNEPDEATDDEAADPVAAVLNEAIAGDDQEEGEARPPEPAFAEAPDTSVTVGSLDPESGFFLEVDLTSRGAAVSSVRLTPTRFKELEDQSRQLQLLGSTEGVPQQTLATAVEEIDVQLKEFGTSLEQANWVLVGAADAASATFGFTSPDGNLEVRKTYRLHRSEKRGSELEEEWKTNAAGYQIACDLALINKGGKSASVQYELQGPVGLKLENKDHARKFRDVPVGFLVDGQVDTELITSKEIFDQYDAALQDALHNGDRDAAKTANAALEAWTSDIKYIGVDGQFFASLLVPLDDRSADERAASPRIAVSRPMLIRSVPNRPQWSDVSVRLTSTPLTISPGATIEHKWLLYAGPKREQLLSPEPMAAGEVLQYGWFGFVARRMVSLLGFLHGLGFPYFLAIITMTLMVRGALFPLSRKQALGAKKMKELQPEIAALKEKYGDDKEKMARAQMELFRKHKYNPFSGCLPMFIQLPIFIGLYTALNAAVDLRLAKFLWVDNLAAPDKLFKLPFELPFLGSDFNLLPLITVVLFLIQQKLFMPPPTDEQSEMQQKMMNFMTIFMGFLFWHVPAGLCVYFIASSLWGIGERKMLDFGRSESSPTPETVPKNPDSDRDDEGNGRHGGGGGGSPKPDDAPRKPPSAWERLLEAANASDGSSMQATSAKSDNRKARSGKKKRRKQKQKR